MITPSLDYMEQAWDEAKYGRPSRRPFTHFIIQSATDPSLAPPGHHTVSLWGHHFPYRVEGDIDDCSLRQPNVESLGLLAPDALRKGCQGLLTLQWRTGERATVLVDAAGRVKCSEGLQDVRAAVGGYL
jgi:hypothetical protein